MSENLVNPSVPITLDGQDYVLRYRAMAFIQYASECERDLLHDIRTMGAQLAEFAKLEAEGNFGALAPILVTLRDVLWAGLIDAQPLLQRIEVSRLFGLQDFPVLMPQITKAVMAGLPDTGSARPTKPATKPVGRNSRLINGAGSGHDAGTQAGSGSLNSAG